ncbi:hypothetical protein ACIPY6_40770 [Streptomyces sp. NPDC090054]|uniref:hypothetical protein n=1 Tax=Streptomyces sp. NPDC090054 TaxID=3365933 RepID=UPI003803724E
MNIRSTRWLLAPIRQHRSLQLVKRHGPSLPYDTAWALITLHTAPDEKLLVHVWARENPDSTPGIHYDRWIDLSEKEQRRRQRWLRRHNRSPIQLLDLEADLILSTGLHVLDWGPPSQPRGPKVPTPQRRPDTKTQA